MRNKALAIINGTLVMVTAIIVIWLTLDFVITLYLYTRPPQYALARHQTASNYNYLYSKLLEHTQAELDIKNFVVPEEYRFSPTVRCQSHRTINVPIALVYSVQERKSCNWLNISEQLEPPVPIIFPFSYYPDDLCIDKPGQSFICFSDRSMKYDYNPMLCEVHLTDIVFTSIGFTGEYMIHLPDNDDRFGFSKKFSSLKVILPVPEGITIVGGCPFPQP